MNGHALFYEADEMLHTSSLCTPKHLSNTEVTTSSWLVQVHLIITRSVVVTKRFSTPSLLILPTVATLEHAVYKAVTN